MNHLHHSIAELPPMNIPEKQFRSHKHRALEEFRLGFYGLEEGVNRYELLVLVKKVGKAAGFTPRMIQLLDYYMAFTRDVDWEEGSRPIIYQSLARTALDLGISERQVQKLEQSLFQVGAINWNSSGNNKRHGQRDPKTGRLIYAFGVELTPLASLRQSLEEKLQEKELYENAWMETKRQISWYRSQIRKMIQLMQEEGRKVSLISELEQQYQEISIPIRTHIKLPQLRSLLVKHKSLMEYVNTSVEETDGDYSLQEAGDLTSIPNTSQLCFLTCASNEITPKDTPNDEQKFAHIKPFIQTSLNKFNTAVAVKRHAGELGEIT